MKHILTLALLTATLCQASTLDEALARMDKAASGFRGLTAKVRRVDYTAVIKDTAEETGKITLIRPKPKDLRMLVEFTAPEPRAVSFQNRKAQIYYPKIQTVQEYDLGKQGSLIDQFVLLGFGSTSADIRRSYDIKLAGEETVGGVKTDRLELTPKTDEARQHVKLIEIWLSQADGMAQQQKIHLPSKDYKLFTYSEIRVNPALTEASVKLNLPKGVKRETPQK